MQSHAEASVSTFAASIGRIKSPDPGRGSAGRAEVAFKRAAQLFKSNGFGEDGDAFRWSDGRSWCLYRTRFHSWNCCRFSPGRSGELIALEQGGCGLKRAEGRPGGPAEGRTATSPLVIYR